MANLVLVTANPSSRVREIAYVVKRLIRIGVLVLPTHRDNLMRETVDWFRGSYPMFG